MPPKKAHSTSFSSGNKANRFNRVIQPSELHAQPDGEQPTEATQVEPELPAAVEVQLLQHDTPQPTTRVGRRAKTMEKSVEVLRESLNTAVDNVTELQAKIAEQKETIILLQKTVTRQKREQQCAPGNKTAGNRKKVHHSYPVHSIRGAYSSTGPQDTVDRRTTMYSLDIVKFLRQQFPDKEHAEAALVKTICRNEYRAALRKAVKLCADVKMGIEQALVDEIESHWTVELGLAYRLKLHLSQRKYQYLINHLSCKYVEDQDKFVRIRVGSGVKMPSFKTHASKNKTVELMQKYFEQMDPEVLEGEPKTISVSLRKVILEHLQTYPLAPDDTELKIKIDGDGAPVMPRVSQTCIAVKVMRTFEDMQSADWEGLNSPFTSHSLLLFDGKEDWDVILKQAARLQAELQDIRENGFEVDGKALKVKIIAGGDLKWLNAVAGLSTCAHTYPCPWCLVMLAQLHCVWGELQYVKRTDRNMREYAHLHQDYYEYPWTCSGCGEVFVDRAQLEGEGQPATNAKRLEFQLKHFGVGWHKYNLWGCAPEDMVADLLHFNLREVHFMLERTGKRFLLTQDDVDRYCQFLKDHAGVFIKVKKESKKQGAKKEKTPNVIGREIEAIVRIYEAIMKVVHVEGSENYLLAIKVWQAFVSLYKALLARLPKGHTTLDRVKKAASIKKLAGDYMEAKLYLGSAGEDGTLYSHIAFWHFPEMILRHGDLVDLSTQALEHLHWLRKKDYRDLSNKGEKAMAQLMKTEWSRAKIKKKVASRETSTNKKRRAANAMTSGEATE